MTPRPSRRRWAVAASSAVVLLAAAACGNDTGAEAGAGPFQEPDQVAVVVHTGPGGGGDILARQIVAMMEEEEIIERGSWTVDNRDGGGSAVAVNYMVEQQGRDDIISIASNVWLTNAMTTEGISTSALDLSPIAGLYQDNFGIAVRADSPFQTLSDYVDAATAEPNTLIQVGGSNTSNDALVGQILQRESGATWRFLSFPSGGERRTALLRGDGDVFLSESGDLVESVEAGDMRLLALVGEERSPLFPDVPTTVEQGFTEAAPDQVRYALGPPGMSAEAVDYYEAKFKELTESPTFAAYIEDVDADGVFRSTEDFAAFLQEQKIQHVEIFEGTGQLVASYS